MSFEVQLEQFDGPLHLLLDLIESQKLPITEVSLSQVTDAYLGHMKSTNVPPEELADFLVVATKLLLLKSRAILPVDDLEPDEDPSILALQLRLYKEFVDASKHLEKLFEGPQACYGRLKADVVKIEGLEVAQGLTDKSIHQSFISLLTRLEPFFRLQQVAMERVVSVKERLREIHDAVLSRSRLHFFDMIKNGQSKVDIVVSFLALLELVKQQAVSVMQQDTFQDIEIQRVD